MKTKNKKAFIVSSLIGLIGGGIATKIVIDRNENKPAHILKRIQIELSSIGTIGDSWISSTPDLFEDKKVYTGIVQVTEGKKKYQLQFKADIKDGSVLEMKRLNK